MCRETSAGAGRSKTNASSLRTGALLAPASREDGYWRCFADRSEDGGRTWRRGEDVPCAIPRKEGRGVIQPTLWQSADETVHMLMRSSEGAVYKSDSADGGRTWTPARRTPLPNNNSGVDLARLADGRLALAYNPVAVNWGPRSPLALALSYDDGESWSGPCVLEHVPCEKNETRAEFSYPAIAARGEELLLTYTYKRETIVFRRLAAPPLSRSN